MSLQRNKATMEEFYDLINSRRINEIDKLFTDDFKGHNIPKGAENDLLGMKAMFATFLNAFPDLKINLEEMIGEKDKVVARTKLIGTHQGDLFGMKGSGKLIQMDSIDVVRFSNGKYAEHWGQADMMSMMRQLGLG